MVISNGSPRKWIHLSLHILLILQFKFNLCLFWEAFLLKAQRYCISLNSTRAYCLNHSYSSFKIQHRLYLSKKDFPEYHQSISKGLLIYTLMVFRFLPLSLYPLHYFHCSFICEPLECRDCIFHLCLMSFLQACAYWMICMKEGWKSRSFAQLHLAMFLWFLL